MRASSARGPTLVLLTVTALAFPKLAHAEATRCEDAYVHTQQLRNAGKLRQAREEALVCGQDLCTRTIRTDCARWLQEIEEATPSIVIEARDDAGVELSDVRVSVDDQPLTEKLDGRALQVDPGEHVFRFEYGEQLQVQNLLIREAEKYRRVPIVFAASQNPAHPEPAPPAPPPPREASIVATPAPAPAAVPARTNDAISKPIPVAAQVLGGFAVAALVTFTALAASGYSSEQHMRDTCARTQSCSKGDVRSVRTRYLLADIALGLGALTGTGAAAIWIFAEPENPSSGPAARSATTFGFGVRGAL